MNLPKTIIKHIGDLPISEILLGETSARVFKVGQRYHLKTQPYDDSAGAESLLLEDEIFRWLGMYIEVPSTICVLTATRR